MQSVSSKIWTRGAVFISYDDNNYTTGTSERRYLYRTSPHHYYVPWGKCTLSIRRSLSCTVHPRGIPVYFYCYNTQQLVPHYFYLIRLVTSCYGYLKYYAYSLYKGKWIVTVFLLKSILNGLSQLKCLSRRFRKYLPMLVLVSLQNGGFKPDYSSISIFS